MANLILFILAVYAAWFVFTTSELPVWESVRDSLMTKSPLFAKFILCPICSGFWVSVALSLMFPLLGEPSNLYDLAVKVGLQALGGAGAIYLIERHMVRLEER